MFYFVPNIGGSDIIVEALGIVFYYYLALTFAFVFPLNEFLFDRIVTERLYERTEFLLLVVSCRSTRVHEDRRADDCCQNLRLFELSLVDVKHDKQVKIDPFVIVSC